MVELSILSGVECESGRVTRGGVAGPLGGFARGGVGPVGGAREGGAGSAL
jgi:hypothetical protein